MRFSSGKICSTIPQGRTSHAVSFRRNHETSVLSLANLCALLPAVRSLDSARPSVLLTPVRPKRETRAATRSHVIIRAFQSSGLCKGLDCAAVASVAEACDTHDSKNTIADTGASPNVAKRHKVTFLQSCSMYRHGNAKSGVLKLTEVRLSGGAGAQGKKADQPQARAGNLSEVRMALIVRRCGRVVGRKLLGRRILIRR